MKAMLLAAGRGERMRPLTDDIPKPLLHVGTKTLIEHRLESLRTAGITECVINLSYRAEQIRHALGDGSRWNMLIRYSDEGDEPLETAGGIIQALPLLGEQPFILTNSDIWTDFNFAQLELPAGNLAHLVLVNNPEHNRTGDFALHDGLVASDGGNRLTYSGIGVYHPGLFAGYAAGKRPLLPVLLNAIKTGQVSGQHYHGMWCDIGTPARLADINARSG